MYVHVSTIFKMCMKHGLTEVCTVYVAVLYVKHVQDGLALICMHRNV